MNRSKKPNFKRKKINMNQFFLKTIGMNSIFQFDSLQFCNMYFRIFCSPSEIDINISYLDPV